MIRGREFTDADTASSPGVVIINEALQKEYFKNENPIGQQILIAKGMGPPFEEPARQIVGVVGNTHDRGLDQDTPPLMIVPDSQVLDAMTALNAKIVPLRWAVRTHGDPRQLSAAISEQLRQASGGFPVSHVRTMDEIVSRTTSRQSFNMMLLTIFGAIALVLAAIGIYGLIAYSVQQRTQEIGIRMALGADRATIRKMIVWDGMKLTLIGVVLGHRRFVRTYAPDCQFLVWREDVGSDGVYRCAGGAGNGGFAGGVAAGHASLARGADDGAAGGVTAHLKQVRSD